MRTLYLSVNRQIEVIFDEDLYFLLPKLANESLVNKDTGDEYHESISHSDTRLREKLFK